MRLLLTGADGFTGQHLMRAAQAAGYEVTALKADLTNAESVASEVQFVSPTHVVHLGAISAVTHQDEMAFYRVNLFGTQNLLNALASLEPAPHKVLLASSANVYGDQGGVAIAESVCPKPVNHYAMSKLAMEHMAMTFTSRLPIVITRPFNYTGPGHDLRFVIPKIIDHFVRNAQSIELGNLDVFREYNDIRMVCDVYLKLLHSGGEGEIYNVCTGKAYSLRDILRHAQGLTGHEITVEVNPAYIRPNEVHQLTGNHAKLSSAIGTYDQHDLDQTLTWMLERHVQY